MPAQPTRTLLRAAWVVPMVTAPMRDAAVLVAGQRIVAVGPWNTLQPPPGTRTVDLGNAIVLPGLINAHCHLDYTDMAGQISSSASFSAWIKGMLALKGHRTYSDYALSWLKGAQMLLRHGTTTVCDIEAVPELLPEVLSATPLRVCSLLELTGVRSRRSPSEIVRETVERIESIPAHLRWAGLSPHAPYSTVPELLRLSAQTSRARGWLMATHLAESEEEFTMFIRRKGAMFEWLHPQRDMSDCGSGSPIQLAHTAELLGPNLLAVHANYLAPRDADLLARTGTHVVHCPRSHTYFGHALFRREDLTKAGVNICLGTDSLASVKTARRATPELDLFAEMRAMRQADKSIDGKTLVCYVTLNAARALGRVGELGQLSPGACADLVAIPASPPPRDVYDAIVEHRGPVSASMIEGQWAIESHA